MRRIAIAFSLTLLFFQVARADCRKNFIIGGPAHGQRLVLCSPVETKGTRAPERPVIRPHDLYRIGPLKPEDFISKEPRIQPQWQDPSQPLDPGPRPHPDFDPLIPDQTKTSLTENQFYTQAVIGNIREQEELINQWNAQRTSQHVAESDQFTRASEFLNSLKEYRESQMRSPLVLSPENQRAIANKALEKARAGDLKGFAKDADILLAPELKNGIPAIQQEIAEASPGKIPIRLSPKDAMIGAYRFLIVSSGNWIQVAAETQGDLLSKPYRRDWMRAALLYREAGFAAVRRGDPAAKTYFELARAIGMYFSNESGFCPVNLRQTQLKVPSLRFENGNDLGLIADDEANGALALEAARRALAGPKNFETPAFTTNDLDVYNQLTSLNIAFQEIQSAYPDQQKLTLLGQQILRQANFESVNGLEQEVADLIEDGQSILDEAIGFQLRPDGTKKKQSDVVKFYDAMRGDDYFKASEAVEDLVTANRELGPIAESFSDNGVIEFEKYDPSIPPSALSHVNLDLPSVTLLGQKERGVANRYQAFWAQTDGLNALTKEQQLKYIGGIQILLSVDKQSMNTSSQIDLLPSLKVADLLLGSIRGVKEKWSEVTSAFDATVTGLTEFAKTLTTEPDRAGMMALSFGFKIETALAASVDPVFKRFTTLVWGSLEERRDLMERFGWDLAGAGSDISTASTEQIGAVLTRVTIDASINYISGRIGTAALQTVGKAGNAVLNLSDEVLLRRSMAIENLNHLGDSLISDKKFILDNVVNMMNVKQYENFVTDYKVIVKRNKSFMPSPKSLPKPTPPAVTIQFPTNLEKIISIDKAARDTALNGIFHPDPTGIKAAIEYFGEDFVRNIWSYDSTVSSNYVNALRHFVTHQKEFPEFRGSFTRYVEEAHKFVKNWPPDAEVYLFDDGNIRLYQKSTNTFASFDPDLGTVKTFFKPDDYELYFQTLPGKRTRLQ